MDSIRFFEPNKKMVQWLKAYIGNRLPVDVGCGDGYLLTLLGKGVGIDPNFNGDRRKLLQRSVHILEQPIELSRDFLKPFGAKGIMIFARPCHSDFVENGIRIAPEGMEILYITKPENIAYYNDLGAYDNLKVLLKHEGKAKENEIVFSIRK